MKGAENTSNSKTELHLWRVIVRPRSPCNQDRQNNNITLVQSTALEVPIKVDSFGQASIISLIMEHHYLDNPAIQLLLPQIEPSSKEKEVQVLWENLLWTVFPAAENWLNTTKHREGGSEPDNKVTKLVQFNTGWANVDVLIVELKRRQEKISQSAFNRVAKDYLDDHMNESQNQSGTVLFGAIGLGKYVQFYQKTLPDGALIASHEQPFHLKHNCDSVQQFFEHFKVNIPASLRDAAEMPTPSVASPTGGAGQPSGSQGYQMGSTSMYTGGGGQPSSQGYQMGSTSMYTGGDGQPSSQGYQMGSTSMDTEAGQSYGDNKGSVMEGGGRDVRLVIVTRITHNTRKDDYEFRDKKGKKRTTLREDWTQIQHNGNNAWKYSNYVCLDASFGIRKR